MSCAKDVTGRGNSIKLGTAKGRVAYLCDSETDMVEWISALEGTIARLVRVIAGVDDSSSSGGGNGNGGNAGGGTSAAANAKFLQQMEVNFRREAPAPAAAPRAPDAPKYHYSGTLCLLFFVFFIE